MIDLLWTLGIMLFGFLCAAVGYADGYKRGWEIGYEAGRYAQDRINRSTTRRTT